MHLIWIPLTVGLVGVLLATVVTMPHPYAGLRPVTVEQERLDTVGKYPAVYDGGVVKNQKLRDGSKRLFDGKVRSSEGVSAYDGTLYMLDRYGWVHTADVKTHLLKENVTYVGPGRPLGFHVNKAGLFVCDSVKGVLYVEHPLAITSEVRILVNTDDDNKPINYFNDLDIQGDLLFFSSSSEGPVALDSSIGYYDTMNSFLMNAMRGDASGRIFQFNLKTKEIKTIASGVWYANGVAVDAQASNVYYVETLAHRVHRVNLETGVSEVVVSKLPGYPDGISFNADRTALYVSLVAPMSPVGLTFPYPMLRLVLSHLSPLLSRLAKPHGCVVKVTPQGDILDTLMDQNGERVSSVSSATEYQGSLYLGNLKGDYISYYVL
eukprot:TRINITY_DN1955_c1_g2_i1.p1 TRINITY_DN1955_c1_g2~~TRINITY_DN1955_c1_g2_i1.p1  ORF type:complete len:394 (+),score=78.34 TRINITY_DN1955_c1_g2_i1:51-1184(+)